RDEAAHATRADGSTVVLLRPQDSWQKIDQPEVERRLGDLKRMNGLAGIELEAISRGASTVIIGDYITASMMPAPPGARSALAAAFLYEDHVVGVIHLFNDNAN